MRLMGGGSGEPPSVVMHFRDEQGKGRKEIFKNIGERGRKSSAPDFQIVPEKKEKNPITLHREGGGGRLPTFIGDILELIVAQKEGGRREMAGEDRNKEKFSVGGVNPEKRRGLSVSKRKKRGKILRNVLKMNHGGKGKWVTKKRGGWSTKSPNSKRLSPTQSGKK